MIGPTFEADSLVAREENADVNLSLPTWAIHGASGVLLGIVLMLLFGFRRRQASIPVHRALPDARRPPVVARRGVNPLAFLIGEHPTPSRRVFLVPPTRVRLISASGERTPGRACRFCGLSVSEGDHSTCQQGVLDG